MTSSDQSISKQAVSLYRKFSIKHSSFIHSKHRDTLNCIFQYQKNISEPINFNGKNWINVALVHGNREQVVSTINPVYGSLQSKKTKWTEFLKLLFLILEDHDEMEYMQYIAIIICTLEYKESEEMHTLYKEIDQRLSIIIPPMIELLEDLKSKQQDYSTISLKDDKDIKKSSLFLLMRKYLGKRFSSVGYAIETVPIDLMESNFKIPIETVLFYIILVTRIGRRVFEL
jgi:hypothetical protein